MTKRDIKETFSLGDISVGDIEVTGHGRIGHCQRDIFVVTRFPLYSTGLFPLIGTNDHILPSDDWSVVSFFLWHNSLGSLIPLSEEGQRYDYFQ